MREDLIIYGAGGLGREACCLTQLLDRWNILGFVDDGKKPGEVIDGKEVLDLAQILKVAPYAAEHCHWVCRPCRQRDPDGPAFRPLR